MIDQNRSGTPGSLGDQGGGADNGSSDAVINPFQGLERDSLKWIESNGARTVADVVKMARNSEKLSGGIHLPKKDASLEEVQSFFDNTLAQFVPDDVSEYQLSQPENLPEHVPYDEDMVERFKSGMHERGIPPQMADQVHDWYLNDVLIPGYEEELAARQEAADDATEELHRSWGKPGSSEFDTNLEHALKAVSGLGERYREALIEAGAIDEEHNVLQADLIAPLAKIGALHFSEDLLVTGGNSPQNPFSQDSLNWAKANEIVNNDPSKAKSLILSAGKNPADYGL